MVNTLKIRVVELDMQEFEMLCIMIYTVKWEHYDLFNLVKIGF